MNRGRASAVAAAAVGLLAATAVIGYFNAGDVLAAMKPIGPGGFLIVIGAQLALFAPLGGAWWLASLESLDRAPAFMWGRLLREAASDVLPFSQLGGVVIGARGPLLAGASTSIAVGSSVIDLMIEIVAQLAYTLFGVWLLADRLGLGAARSPLLAPLLIGVGIAACFILGVIVARKQASRMIESWAERLIPAAAEGASAVNQVIEAALARPLRLFCALGLHISAWFGAAVGTWLILRFIDHPLPFLSVAAIESLLFAIRNAAFFVPSALGVQEGAYALVGPLFGLPADAALALSLLKRARDITIGVPALISWQIAEVRRRR